ncbi:hypothetical protein CWO24_23340 [Vibrio sp. 10N.286.46.E10]|nr:SUMF1/EgtB/PvdO family nonheme iron enzyme [Vibrio sp. 10N.286.46.E10]PTQ19194.1 hypothetical protein CWO24_23340 [Vibrio sp. 10N.286.46.E10]
MKNNIYFVLVIFFSFSLVIVISTMSSLNDIPALSVNNLKVKSDNHYLDLIIDDNRSYISKNHNIRDSLRQPEVEINIKNKFIQRCEVTQKEFNQFVQNSPGREERSTTFSHKISGQLSSPVTGVNFLQAQRYCDSVGGRLPTQYEWEAAATGIERRLYPWGNSFSNDDNPYIDPIFNTTKSCGKVISTSTPNGIHDLSGNVSEWVLSDQSGIIKGGNGFDKDSILSSLNLSYLLTILFEELIGGLLTLLLYGPEEDSLLRMNGPTYICKLSTMCITLLKQCLEFRKSRRHALLPEPLFAGYLVMFLNGRQVLLLLQEEG